MERERAAPAPRRWLEAWRALRALIRDPDDTGQVFRIIRALSSGGIDRPLARFRATPLGRVVLAERRSLLARLADRDALAGLPPGTLGRAYADFIRAEQITPEGLVDASLEAPLDPATNVDQQIFSARMRDSHDLWHVVTGYGRDLVGEAALLAFTYRQTRNPGVGLIVLAAWWKAGRALPGGRAMIREGLARGNRAAWLPAADWEALLDQPLDEVRRMLRVEPVARPTSTRSVGAAAPA